MIGAEVNGQGESVAGEAEDKVRRHADGALSVWHGPRKLAKYGPDGERLADALPAAA